MSIQETRSCCEGLGLCRWHACKLQLRTPRSRTSYFTVRIALDDRPRDASTSSQSRVVSVVVVDNSMEMAVRESRNSLRKSLFNQWHWPRYNSQSLSLFCYTNLSTQVSGITLT